MSVNMFSLSDEEKRAIDEAAERLHYVARDEEGNKIITIYADYRDTNEGLLDDAYDIRRIGFEPAEDYDPEHALLYTLQDKVESWYQETEWEIEDAILKEAGVDFLDDKMDLRREYLRDNYCITPDFDHFLDQSMKVNIMLAFDSETNKDFVSIHEQYEAMNGLYPEEAKDALEEETGLSWLVKQQGHTMEDLQKTFKEYYEFFDSDVVKEIMDYDKSYSLFGESHNKFLTSVCQELGNMTNYMNTMTILSSMSMKEFAEMMQPGKEVVMPIDTMVGIFNPWNGGGSTLEIELEKDLVIPSELIWDVQIEGAKLGYQYSVDNVYGLIGSAWKGVRTVRDAEHEKKAPSLDSIIQSAAQRSAASMAGNEQQNDISVNPQERG